MSRIKIKGAPGTNFFYNKSRVSDNTDPVSVDETPMVRRWLKDGDVVLVTSKKKGTVK